MKALKEGDLITYMGGAVGNGIFGHAFTKDKQYKVFSQNIPAYGGVVLYVRSDTGKKSLIQSPKGLTMRARSFAHSIDTETAPLNSLGLTHIEIKVEIGPSCNCGAEGTPKGCSTWCNIMPLRKVSQ